jgi:hypothetical protein
MPSLIILQQDKKRSKLTTWNANRFCPIEAKRIESRGEIKKKKHFPSECAFKEVPHPRFAHSARWVWRNLLCCGRRTGPHDRFPYCSLHRARRLHMYPLGVKGRETRPHHRHHLSTHLMRFRRGSHSGAHTRRDQTGLPEDPSKD